MRFNPPPNLPVGQPGQIPDEGVPWPSHTGRNVMIGIASAIAVVVAVVVVYVVSSDSGTAGSHARPSSYAQLGSKPESDEDQIRATLSGIEDAWNSSDYATFITYACGRIRNIKSNTESEFTQQRNEIGAITFAVGSISVGGGTANVEVTETFSNQGTVSETLNFLKEDDEWKLC
jgi:hypothetical protein